MTDPVPFVLRNRNPDVLTCIANLSNDEVFTPPELANRMLDALTEAWAHEHGGANLWADKTVTYLDPCTKSGVFLREITKRLVAGLADEIPDLQERVDHILTKQVFGIGITRLTGMLARRSVYCSKYANGKHSICKKFTNESGHIWFERVEHSWDETKCRYCEAPRTLLDRGDDRENYAYAFIHTDDIKNRIYEMFGGPMQFDVIIGNPPYQMKGGAGGTSDSSIYHYFVEQAKKLEPRYLTMVIPSRWIAGGRGMEEFRKEMLSSHKLLKLVDYPVSKEVFPGVDIMGGICYFLWSQAYNGPCEVTLIRNQEKSTAIRELDEFDIFVREPMAVGILRKVLSKGERSITEILTADTPFGIATNFAGFHEEQGPGDIPLYYVQQGKRGVGYIPRRIITKNVHLIDAWKVLVPKAHGSQTIPIAVLGKPWISPPPSAATQSFLAFWLESEAAALSLASYYRTKFFRYLVSLRKLTQDALRSTYSWVPLQKWDHAWTDKELYEKYSLTQEEIDYIESVIRPMEVNGEDTDAQND